MKALYKNEREKKMKKVLLFVAVLLIGFGFAACKEDDGKIVIGANIYTYGDNFMNAVVRPELERYATEKGITLDIVDSENDQAKLNDQVDVFISKGVDALAINLVDPAAASTIINKAKAANIPLILFNKEATEAGVMATYDKVWYVGTDSAEAGVIQGEMMVVDQLAIQASTTWNTGEAQATMQSWLSNATFGDNIELVISNNDGMAFGAYAAMEEANIFLPLYGVDALTEALTMIGADEMNGTVLNDGVNQARATLDLAINAAQGKDVTEGTDWVVKSDGTKAVRVAYVAVTKANYQDFLS